MAGSIVYFFFEQNQCYPAGTNSYQFHNPGTFQLTGIPDGTTAQVEFYGCSGIWTAHFGSTSSGGRDSSFTKLNSFTVNGGTLRIIVGKDKGK